MCLYIRSLEFDKLTRLVLRQTNLSEPLPPLYLRVLSTLDDAVSKEKEGKKKMDANKARALNTMKQKVKKTIKEYELQMKEFTADPLAFTAQYAAATQPEVLPKPKKAKKGRGDDEDGEEVDAFTTVGKGGKTYSLGVADIYKNLAAIQEARGKKVPTSLII